MIDLVTLVLKAGNGGHGKVSFRREKYAPKGGPDGAQGGDGGSIRLVGSRRFNTLKHYAGKKEILAPAGQKGGKVKKTGAQGEDVVMEVPLGTHVWLTAENNASARRRAKYSLEYALTRSEVSLEQYQLPKPAHGPNPATPDGLKPLPAKIEIAVIDHLGQELILCQGGFGGRGNISFKGSTNRTPMEAEYGSPGEQKEIVLELKLLADVGLVGYPNAGKSTLLSKITRAQPKIANYPFTTLEPNLGVLNLPERELIVADIPGLIEGAHQGKGLGLDFLRHVENSQALLFLLFLEENVIFDQQKSSKTKAELVWQQYQQLRDELGAYHPDLLKKPAIVSVNKVDLYPAELLKAIEQQFKKQKIKLYPLSGATGEGLDQMTKALTELTR